MCVSTQYCNTIHEDILYICCIYDHTGTDATKLQYSTITHEQMKLKKSKILYSLFMVNYVFVFVFDFMTKNRTIMTVTG